MESRLQFSIENYLPYFSVKKTWDLNHQHVLIIRSNLKAVLTWLKEKL